MSEFWGFHATKLASIDRAAIKASVKKLKIDAVLTVGANNWLYIHTPKADKIRGFANVVLHYFDHEGSAWDFDVYVKGKRIGGGVFGSNAETGAKNQGFTGDLDATAKALGVDAKKLKAACAKDSKKWFALLALEHMAMPENEVPKGVAFFDEIE